MRVALSIQYDGRRWRGWQSQPDRLTIQDTLEQALSSFADQPIRVHAAGRTDAGVHALGQITHFDTTAVRELNGWVRGVNALLPDSIAVNAARFVGDDFHARFSAVARRYYYVLFNHPIRSAHLAGRAGWLHNPLDLEAMRQAAQLLEGTHDFSAFRSAECQAKSPVKTMYSVRIDQHGQFLVFSFHASAFLHHQIRNLVGSLLVVGKGRNSVQWLGEILAGLDRSKAAPTFMPDGLYFAAADYPEQFDVPPATPLSDIFPGLTA